MRTPRFRYTVDGSDVIQFVSKEWLVYQLMFGRAREKNQEIRLPFRCDSPDLRRFMELSIQPIGDGALNLAGEILRRESRPYAVVLDSNAPRGNYLLQICSWCKKLHLSNKGWVEAETAVSELGLFTSTEIPELTHGICPSCKHELVF